MLEEQILSELEACGVNLSGVLQRFMGNKAIYIKMLPLVLKDTSFIGLKEALLEKDYKKAFGQAHTLKGVAGNLGFDNVLESLVPMVEILRQTDTADSHLAEIDSYMEKVTVEYGKVLKILESLKFS